MLKKIISTAFLLLCIITCIMFGIYRYQSYSIIPKYEQKLHEITHNRAQEINTYLNNQEKNALQLSSSFAEAMKDTSSDRQEKTTALFAPYKENMGFKNILLIDKDGIITFSTTQKNLVGTDLKQHTNSPLSKSYERASMTLTTDFSDFNFDDLLHEPALYITIPILHNKKFIGTLSYQLNQEKIYLIAHQYIGLQKTGEVVLAKKDGLNIVFLAPTRHDADLAFKKRALSTDQPIAIQASVLGQEGTGTGIDYHGNKIVGAWQFIPKLDWGMLIKINQDEIMNTLHTLYTLLLYCLLLLLITLLCNAYIFSSSIKKKLHHINHQWPCNRIPALLKNPLFIIFFVFCGLAFRNIIICKKETSSAVKRAQHHAITTTTENAETITAVLKKIVFVGQSIAQDLQTDYLTHDDINTRITRDMKENNNITEIVLLHQALLRSTNPIIQNASTENVLKAKWYTQAMEKNSAWIVNVNKDEPNLQPTATYACTFLDKENQPNGVIAITFSLKSIIEIADNSGIGQTGYSIIMTDDGTFIYHPTYNLVQTGTTLLQYAQSKGNEELATIAQEINNKKSEMMSYASESTNERMWIYTQPIAINNWIIGSIFSEDEIDLPAETIRHYHFWILIWATISLLLFLALLYTYAIIPIAYYAIIANALLIGALIVSWYVIKKTTTINRESRTIITDQSNLNKFLNDLKDEAERKHETAPINIPCGILLYSLSTAGPDTVTISGYLWNKYNIKIHSDIIRGMDLPQATRMIYGTPLTSKSSDEETSTWNIQGNIYQEQKYDKFPFDQHQLRIILEHRDIEKNIILTPDLIAYKKISPESTPGLDKEFSLSGFTIEQTFFEYQRIDPNANFGFKEYGKVTDHYHLVYNAIINRNLINPFVIYLLPLLVILFTLFTTLLVVKKSSSPLSILAGYSGLFFALIVLQRSLREQYPSGTTLYMEYAFFYTYITIILLMLHSILMYYYKHWETYQNKSLYFMRILFWPFQFIMWLITTIIIFY